MFLFTIVTIGLLLAMAVMPFAWIAFGTRELRARRGMQKREPPLGDHPLPTQRRYA